VLDLEKAIAEVLEENGHLADEAVLQWKKRKDL
jgi:hypothetical protein